MATDPSEFVTAASIATFAGATAVISGITNAAYKLFDGKLSPKWVAFVTALVIAYAVVALQSAPKWYDWLLAFVNACLLFSSALGINEYASGKTTPPSANANFIEAKPFFRSWLGK